MGLFDHETNADTIYYLARLRPGEAVWRARPFIHRLPGFTTRSIVSGGNLIGDDASLFPADDDGNWLIGIARNLPDVRYNLGLWHEASEWFHYGTRDPLIEIAVDQLAITLAAPRQLVVPVVRALSFSNVSGVARVFTVTEQAAAVRIAEATGRPVALVRAARFVGQAGEPYEWCVETLERMARDPEEQHPQVRRVRSQAERQLEFFFAK